MSTGSTIVSVSARQIFSDRGHPGVETTVTTENGAKGVAVVTAGSGMLECAQGTPQVKFEDGSTVVTIIWDLCVCESAKMPESRDEDERDEEMHVKEDDDYDSTEKPKEKDVSSSKS